MDEENKFKRVTEPDDPNRCQGNSAHGQCLMVAIPGSQYCIQHGGHNALIKTEKDGLRNLKLTKFKARLVQLGNSDNLMSLRDEIAILRITLEETVESCEGASDLITNSGQIAALVNNIGKLVKDCHSIEEKTGHLLSKDALTNFAGKVIDIIVRYVPDEDIKRAIAGEIVNAVGESSKTDQ